jgi:deoxyribonuclease-1
MKTVFVTLLVFVLVPLVNASENVPYYGHQFNQIKSQLKDTALRTKLKEILMSGHIAAEATTQNEDVLVKSCDAVKNCTRQTSLGYERAREFLFGKYYLVNTKNGYGVQEMYCDRIYTAQDFKPGQGLPAPGIVPEDSVINTEHTWPQSHFSGKYSKDLQKADLHHLFPTDSQMNSLRGNSMFGEVEFPTHYTKCNASKFGQGVGTRQNVFEPPQNHKGHIARALFYFAVRYDLQISAAEEVMLKKWNHESPVDQQELDRNGVIQSVQGNRNPFIDYPELADQIADF